MTIVVRPAVAADLPGLCDLRAELDPDDPPLPAVTAQRVWQAIGTRLLEAVGALARSTGCYKIQLLSADTEEAHRYYEAAGFRPVAQGYRRYLD